jgi:hypothetical protein
MDANPRPKRAHFLVQFGPTRGFRMAGASLGPTTTGRTPSQNARSWRPKAKPGPEQEATGETQRPLASVVSGAPGKVRQVSRAERSLPCKLPVRHVAERACVGAIRRAEPREAKVRAASIEPVSASLNKLRVASLPDVVKPATGRVATGEGTGRALRGERGRRVSNDLSGTWETRPDGPRSNGSGEGITG